jgi:4-alpha-glucanotransferase
MTSTHDLAPTAGWWAGHDIEIRAALGGFADEEEIAAERLQRTESRHFLWGALRHAEVACGEEPEPATTDPVVDAAARYAAVTPCRLAILPLEDVLGVLDQPNLPGTVDEHPNWRRRLPGEAACLLDAPCVEPRLDALRRRGSNGGAASG